MALDSVYGDRGFLPGYSNRSLGSTAGVEGESGGRLSDDYSSNRVKSLKFE